MKAVRPHRHGSFRAVSSGLTFLVALSLTGVQLLSNESVNPRSGKLELAETDLTLPCGSVLLAIERFYEPGIGPSSLLGRGWRLSIEKHLTRSGDKAVLHEGNQSKQFRRQPGTNAYAGDAGEELVFASPGNAVLTKADATKESYDASGHLVEQRFHIGAWTHFQYDTSGRLARIDGAGGGFFTFTADPTGRISRIESSSGMAVVYRYNGGNLTEFQVDRRPVVRYGYDAKSRLTRIEDPRDGNVELVYDDEDRIVSRKPIGSAPERFEYDDIAGTIRHTDPAGGVTTAVFHADRNLQEISDPLGQKTTIRSDDGHRTIAISQPSGATSTFKYDPLGRLVSSTKGNEEIRLEYAGNTQLPAAIRYPDGSRQTFEYDKDHNLAAIREGEDISASFSYNDDGMPASARYQGRGEWRYLYDSDGHLKSQTDAEGQTMRFEYDRHGNLVRRIDPAGGATSFGYDDQDRPVSRTDPAGATTKYAYDPAGRLRQWSDPLGGITRFDYDAGGRVLTKTDAAGRTTRFKYDAAGRRVGITYPGGATYGFEYDAAGNVIRALNPLGGMTRYRYDADGQIASITDPTGGTWKYEFSLKGRLAKIINPAGEITALHHDALGRGEGFTDPAGRSVRYERDAKGRLAKMTLPGGGVRTATYDKDGHLTGEADNQGQTLLYEHDALGRVSRKKSSTGLEIESRYDALGRLAGVRDNLGRALGLRYTPGGQISALIDSTGGSTKFSYDLEGKLTEVIDPLGAVKRFAFSPVGELTNVREANGDSVKLKYDEAGRINIIQHPGGGTTRLDYNPMSSPLRITDPLGAQTSLTYDEAGRLIGVTDPEGRITSLFYDLAGRLSKRQQADGTLVTTKYGPTGKVAEVDDGEYPVRYSYDETGRVTSIEYPAARKLVKYGYDDAGLLVKVTNPDGRVIQYKYDDRKKLVAIQLTATSVFRFSYDDGGRLKSQSYPNGIAGTWEYDTAGRASRITYSNASGQPVYGWSYRYDAAGNLASTLDLQGRATKYAYDASGQLLEEAGPEGTIHYSYAAGGNRAKRDAGGHVILYEHNAADQLIKAGPEAFSYDKRGNLIERKGPGGVTHYSYDHSNRLAKAILPNGNEVRFGYAPTGERVWRRDRKGITYYVTDGIHVLAEVDEKFNPRISYVYAPGLDYPVALLDGEKSLFYHLDRLGSVAALTDSAGKASAAYEADAFGVPTSGPKEIPNRFLFTAREYEADLGLYYYRARFYDPSLGRFLSRDPAPASPTQAASLNAYIYVSNNPTRFVDPLGLEQIKIPLDFQWLDASPLSTCPYCQQTKEPGLLCRTCGTNRLLTGARVFDDEFIRNNWDLTPDQITDLQDTYIERMGITKFRSEAVTNVELDLTKPNGGLKGQALYDRLKSDIIRITETPKWAMARANASAMAVLQAGQPVSPNITGGYPIEDVPAEAPLPPPTPEQIAGQKMATVRVGEPPPPPFPKDLTVRGSSPIRDGEGSILGAQVGPTGARIARVGGIAGVAGLGLHGYAAYAETGSGWEAVKEIGKGVATGGILTAATMGGVALAAARRPAYGAAVATAALAGMTGLSTYGVYTGVQRAAEAPAVLAAALSRKLSEFEAQVAAETSQLADLRASAIAACASFTGDVPKAREAIGSAGRNLEALQTLVASLKEAFMKCGESSALKEDLDALSSKAVEAAGKIEKEIGEARQQAEKCESAQLARAAQASYEAARGLLEQLNQWARDGRSKAGLLKSLKARTDTAREALPTARLLKDQIVTAGTQFAGLVNQYPEKVTRARELKAEYEQRRIAFRQKFRDYRGDDPQALPAALEKRFTEIRARADRIPDTIECALDPEPETTQKFGADTDEAKAVQLAAERMLDETEKAASGCGEIPDPGDRLESVESALRDSQQLFSSSNDIPDLLSKCLEKLSAAGARSADAGGFKEVSSIVQSASIKSDPAPGTKTQIQPGTVGGSPGPGAGGGRGGGGQSLQLPGQSTSIAAGQPAAFHIFATGSRLGWAGSLARHTAGAQDQIIREHLAVAGDHMRMANLESYPPTKAWPNWSGTRSQFQTYADQLTRGPREAIRRQVATSVTGSVEPLAQQLNYQTVGTSQPAPNCDAAYMRLGFNLGYGQTGLQIAAAAANVRDTTLMTQARQDAVAHIQQAVRFLLDYERIPVASGRCADLRDVRIELESLIPSWDLEAQVRAANHAWQTALERIRGLSQRGTAPTQPQQKPSAPPRPAPPKNQPAPTPAPGQPSTSGFDPEELAGEWFECAGPWGINETTPSNAQTLAACLQTRTSRSAQAMGTIPLTIRFTKNGNQYSGIFSERNRFGTSLRSSHLVFNNCMDYSWRPGMEIFRLTRTGPNQYVGQLLQSDCPGAPWEPSRIVVDGDVATEYFQREIVKWVRSVPMTRR